MAARTFEINKGINRSIVFKGLKSQYIWYMGGAMFVLLILYALMYLFKVSTFISLGIIICLATGSIMGIYQLSASYGEHGLTKALAARKLPRLVRSTSHKPFESKRT